MRDTATPGFRQCPGCLKPASLLPVWMVYPGLTWLEHGDPLRLAQALVCWGCKQMRQRAAAWQSIDWRRHEQEWRDVNEAYAFEDQPEAPRRKRKRGRR